MCESHVPGEEPPIEHERVMLDADGLWVAAQKADGVLALCGDRWALGNDWLPVVVGGRCDGDKSLDERRWRIVISRADEKVTVERLTRPELQARLQDLQERRARESEGEDRSIDAVVSRAVLEDDIADLKWMLASAR